MVGPYENENSTSCTGLCEWRHLLRAGVATHGLCQRLGVVLCGNFGGTHSFQFLRIWKMANLIHIRKKTPDAFGRYSIVLVIV